MNNLSHIIRREYLERVRRKSFIITTLLMPLFMVFMMALPALTMVFSEEEDKNLAVIDESCRIAPLMSDMGNVKFTRVDFDLDSAKNDERFDGILVIGKDIIANPSDIRLYNHESGTFKTEAAISAQVKAIIEQYRLQAYNIPDLDRILREVNADVTIQTFTISDEGDEESSAIMSYMTGMFLMFLLYMFILLYGQQVMTSIIEEKNNRVLEVVVSSVKPTTLMAGKILGVGAVAITQIIIWGIIVLAFSLWGLPAIVNYYGAPADTDMIAVLARMGDTGYIMKIFGLLTVFVVLGYLFYSSIYAAIGSAVDNIQDASQLQTVAIVPIILAMAFSIVVVNDPGSSLAMWLSFIPFTSPMVMMVRLPFDIPVWQTIVSVAVLVVSVVIMIWFAAKIYRIGIFMYGKKPSYGDLIRWARYK